MVDTQSRIPPLNTHLSRLSLNNSAMIKSFKWREENKTKPLANWPFPIPTVYLTPVYKLSRHFCYQLRDPAYLVDPNDLP